MNFSNISPTEIYAGVGCVLSFNDYSRFGSRCAIITGKNMINHNSALQDVQSALKKENIQYISIPKAINNPSVKSIIDISSIVRSFNADFIIGIGGGSSMDTAKAVAIAAVNEDLNENNIFSVDLFAHSLPVILVGTTAGTGSEVMPSAVLTVDGIIPIKKSLKTHNSYAQIALCDYTYSSSMPDSVTVSTALDTVCHAVEAIYSKRGGIWARIFGHEALKYSFKSILSFTNGICDNDLRENLYFASILGGLAINNGGTSFPHSMGYMLTTMHGVPHGFACAAFIGEFMYRVSQICDVSETLTACGVKTVDDFIIEINHVLFKYFTKLNIDEMSLHKYADLAMKMNVNNNYLNITFNDCLNIYKKTCRS